MNKPPWKSLTLVAGTVFAAVTFLEGAGALPPGTNATLVKLVESVAGLAALYGLRRALPS